MRLVWFYNKLTMRDTCTRLCGHARRVIASMAQTGNNQKTTAGAMLELAVWMLMLFSMG